MRKRAHLIFCVFSLLLSLAFSFVLSTDAFERKRPSPIPPHADSRTPFLPKADFGFCLIQYDLDSVSYYWPDTQAKDGMAVYMNPEECGFDSTYPFKLTNVHFYLYDPGAYVWPVELKINIREAHDPADSIQEPGKVLHYKTFTIPEDSAYDPDNPTDAINLTLDTVFCVHAPFFLEIVYTGGTEPDYPSLALSDTTDRPDTNENWLLMDGDYYEWYSSWVEYLIPGRAIVRVIGYPVAIDCEICWRWMPKTSKVPGGMPDFDQYQFGPDSVSLCGPTALANCLVWLNVIPSITDPDSLIRLLSHYFHTDPLVNGGTLVDSISAGLNSLFADYGLNLCDTVFQNPTFSEIADSLDKSVSTVFLMGLWQNIDDTWYRIGGHYLTPAGVCDYYSWIAVSDPVWDNTEMGARGRILPPHDPHSDDHTLHNTKGFVSHDAYVSDTISITPYATGVWILKSFDGDSLPWLSQFEGQNFQPDQIQYAHDYVPSESLFAVVEYAIMITEKPTLVEKEEEIAPELFELYQSFPNPFNNQTVIKYHLPKKTDVSLVIYNILGQKVRTLLRQEKQSGWVKVMWDGKDDQGRDLGSGIYFYRLQAGESSQIKKMVLLK